MAMIAVEFRFLTGLKRHIFHNARLRGSWDAQGRYSDSWTETPMTEARAEDGCPSFSATVKLDRAEAEKRFRWGVALDGPRGANQWGIATEVPDADSTDRVREFIFKPGTTTRQDYYFTYARRLGARKFFRPGINFPDLRFAVWAPNAQKVEVVFADRNRGYIGDDNSGIDPARPVLNLHKGPDDIWESDSVSTFGKFEGAPYMYRITTPEGKVKYRSDIFSRKQFGRGGIDPAGGGWDGRAETLDGTKSCSVIVSLDSVSRDFVPSTAHGSLRVSEAEFWANEFTPGLAVPNRIEDLIIYELHIGALGFNKAGPGTLTDAMALITNHLVPLGVNAVELLPLSEFTGEWGWGYGDSHHFVIESSAGGRDEYKHFVRECHRHGIAVIQDVCYNHYDYNAERAEWQYESENPEQNIYYWYEGKRSDYANEDGGYLNNGSTGYAPRYSEEIVRQQFVSSAAAFIEEFHVDGLRVDLTQAIHRDNSLKANGWGIAKANKFGAKMLREWSRTLRMIEPKVMLIAEDHSGWDKVTESTDFGGLGFAATWYADFYHDLIGDSDFAAGKARLLKSAGFGGDGPLDISQFSGTLFASQYNKIVYHESHDEAGNAGGTARTIVVAVNGATLWGATREFAEARSRVAFGLSLLSAGGRMFFMGEEVGAQKPFTVMDFPNNREDLDGLRTGTGAKLFRFYQELIQLARRRPAVRSQQIDIIHAWNDSRVIAFTRRSGNDQLLVIASLANNPYLNGYIVQTDPARLPDGTWREVFNSDATIYGGANNGNFGADLPANSGRIEARLPANGFVIFEKL
jgi:1,4-alpha-glucan branching enzyme